jgi:2-phospho-L-lactate guanylyltransferase (CobY/MobA/RfbA family)
MPCCDVANGANKHCRLAKYLTCRRCGMLEDMAETWETKYGSRRVRRDPPTLEEAIAAAQGLSDELDEQIEIAAGLMALPVEAVRAEVLKAAKPVKLARVVMAPSREGATRTVIVERKPSRRLRPTAV